VSSLANLLRRRRGRTNNPFGSLDHIDGLFSPQLGNYRDILISLPGGHKSGEHRYPVIYMHDGQNLFDPARSFAGSWNVDVAMAEVSLDGFDAIVVGIPNMGADRLAEYSPFEHPELGGGRGDLYLEFLINTLKPLIDERFLTIPDREHTGIVGSSMGGLISLYAFFRHPEVFGFAGVLSPSLWLTEEATFSFIEQAPLDVGSREGIHHVAKALHLRDVLEEKGYALGDDLLWVEEEFGRHHEAAWARRFRDALPFLLPNFIATDEYEVPRVPETHPTKA